MIAKKFIKSTVISARPNWLRSIDKRGNTIQSLSASNRDWIIQSTLAFAGIVCPPPSWKKQGHIHDIALDM